MRSHILSPSSLICASFLQNTCRGDVGSADNSCHVLKDELRSALINYAHVCILQSMDIDFEDM